MANLDLAGQFFLKIFGFERITKMYIHDEERCIDCGKCADGCTNGAFHFDGEKIKYDDTICDTMCPFCEVIENCPVCAIKEV